MVAAEQKVVIYPQSKQDCDKFGERIKDSLHSYPYTKYSLTIEIQGDLRIHLKIERK